MGKILKITVWALCLFFLLNTSLDMISEASSIENICGVFLLIIAVSISVKTKCFTQFKSKVK